MATTDLEQARIPAVDELAAPVSARSRSARGLTAIGMAVIFVVAVGIYWASPVRQQSDSFWVAMSARSLVAHGDVDLDEYSTLIKWNDSFQVEHRDGHAYYAVPLLTSLAAVPVVAVGSLFDGEWMDTSLHKGWTQPWDGIAASFIAAATAAVVFAVARRRTASLPIAYATAFIYAFGTQAWGIASRTMWMQGPSMLCLALALWFALRTEESPWWFVALGAMLALAYFVRPTNAVAVLVFAVWAFSHGRAMLGRFAVGAAVVTALCVAANEMAYGLALQPYFRASRLEFGPTVVKALLANLVSPGRGLFVFVPVSILAVAGARSLWRRHAFTSLDSAVVAIVVGYWLGVSCFPTWTGGWSYGPRFMADVAPLLVWFLPAALTAVVAARSTALTLGAVVLVVLAIGIQARGALAPSTAQWNLEHFNPDDVWDWSDPQFLAAGAPARPAHEIRAPT